MFVKHQIALDKVLTLLKFQQQSKHPIEHKLKDQTHQNVGLKQHQLLHCAYKALVRCCGEERT